MIDWSRVSELRGEVGPDDFHEIVEIFLEEMAAELTTLSPTSDDMSVVAVLHSIKGAALSLGFAQIADLCQMGEQAAAAGEKVDLNRLRATLRDSVAAFAAGLAA